MPSSENSNRFPSRSLPLFLILLYSRDISCEDRQSRALQQTSRHDPRRMSTDTIPPGRRSDPTFLCTKLGPFDRRRANRTVAIASRRIALACFFSRTAFQELWSSPRVVTDARCSVSPLSTSNTAKLCSVQIRLAEPRSFRACGRTDIQLFDEPPADQSKQSSVNRSARNTSAERRWQSCRHSDRKARQ